MGLISSIQRFSVDDGPGIRTTVFFKGCNLRCRWCHNPENIDTKPEMQTRLSKCSTCGKCVDICERGARLTENSELKYIKNLCTNCRACEKVCPRKAITICGIEMNKDEVIEQVKKDMPFYRRSGGGVTFSGGEPMLQIDFLTQLLEKCKELDIHAAVDTAGNVPFEFYERIEKYSPLFLFDIKIIDPDLHMKFTQSQNQTILANLRRLSDNNHSIIIRIPVIPSINDNMQAMEKAADFINSFLHIEKVELLPYHGYGEGKYKSLGMTYGMSGAKAPAKEMLNDFIALFEAKGIKVNG